MAYLFLLVLLGVLANLSNILLVFVVEWVD